MSKPQHPAAPAEPHWPSFEHITDEAERHAKELLQSLENLKSRYPHHSRIIAGAIEEIHEELLPRPELDRDCVITALENGRCTVTEIREWTGFGDWKTRKLLGELVFLKRVREDSPGETISKASVGTNVKIYVLLGTHLPDDVKP